jgi:signal transduction histidine kinase
VREHGLRAPLSAITVSAEVARRAAPPDDAILQKAIGHIRTSSARMARMIAQLLDFTHISSGALRLDRQRADLGDVCRGAADELQAGQPQARIEVSATGDLGGTLDADRMAQVFSNLLGNALEHGRDASAQVHLDGSDPQWLHFTVSNAGELPDDVRGSLFVPFRGRRAGSGGGLGLGLHIVDQFVRAHGGEVRGESADGVTRFDVRLPRHAVD